MNRPTIRARLIEARSYATHARVQLQAAEAEAEVRAPWTAIARALMATQEAERSIRHALATTAEDPEQPEDAA